MAQNIAASIVAALARLVETGHHTVTGTQEVATQGNAAWYNATVAATFSRFTAEPDRAIGTTTLTPSERKLSGAYPVKSLPVVTVDGDRFYVVPVLIPHHITRFRQTSPTRARSTAQTVTTARKPRRATVAASKTPDTQ